MPSSNRCSFGLWRTVRRMRSAITASLLPSRRAERRSISPSAIRQGRNWPSAVRRRRLHCKHISWVIWLMKPTVPVALGRRKCGPGHWCVPPPEKRPEFRLDTRLRFCGRNKRSRHLFGIQLPRRRFFLRQFQLGNRRRRWQGIKGYVGIAPVPGLGGKGEKTVHGRLAARRAVIALAPVDWHQLDETDVPVALPCQTGRIRPPRPRSIHA